MSDDAATPEAAEEAVAETPAFDELRPQLDEIVARYPERTAACLPVLWVVQRARKGWLSHASIGEIAEYLELPRAHVEGVITFYTMYRDEPIGQEVVMVCKTISCRLRGAAQVTAALEKKYGIRMGETTADKRFTIESAECLGLCDMAPCMLIESDRVGNLTPESAIQALEDRR